MNVKVSEVQVKPGRRAIREEDVQELAHSIETVGLLNPILIDPDKTLVAGLHRLEAMKLLGRQEIECAVVHLGHLQVELAEIDENIVRTNLTGLALGEALQRRKLIYEELHPETRRGMRNGQTSKTEENSVLEEAVKPFAQDTAEKLGVSRRTVEQLVQTASHLTPEAKDVIREAEKKVTKASALKLSRLEPDQQADAARQLVTGEIRTVDEYHPSGEDPQTSPVAEVQTEVGIQVEEDVNSNSEDKGQYALKVPHLPDKPYILASHVDANVQETEGTLHDPGKGLEGYTPERFLEGYSATTVRVCNMLVAYSGSAYDPAYAEMTPEELAYFRQTTDVLCGLADDLYQYVAGKVSEATGTATAETTC